MVIEKWDAITDKDKMSHTRTIVKSSIYLTLTSKDWSIYYYSNMKIKLTMQKCLYSGKLQCPYPQLLLDLPKQANNFDSDSNLVFQIIKSSKVSMSP
jgi:hypothetical protein